MVSIDYKLSGSLLVLDDDKNVGATIRAIAETAGMECRVTTDPAEFFQLESEWQPTHIALDLIMPDMDGVEVLAELSSRGCTANVIITSGVSGRVLDAAGRSAAEHGLAIAGVLPKPFSPAQLRALLAKNSMFKRGNRCRSQGKIAFIPDQHTLKDALHRRQIGVALQPKVSCVDGQLAGFEALARWRHPEHGLLGPDLFIPIAESSGLIDELTAQIIEQALKWYGSNFSDDKLNPATTVSNALSPGLTLSVNISAKTLDNFTFVDRAVELCAFHHVSNTRLIFELTESSTMADPVASLDLLTRLRMKGFQLSIDDFGTGFSSMIQLVRLPFSEIKVDKSFVMTAMSSQESRSVIRSIVELGNSLGLKSVAEGVEDAETLAFLREVGCDLAQGYYIGRPLPGEDMLKWVASWADQMRGQRTA